MAKTPEHKTETNCKKFNKDFINDSHQKKNLKKKNEATSLGQIRVLRATEDVSKNKNKKEDEI